MSDTDHVFWLPEPYRGAALSLMMLPECAMFEWLPVSSTNRWWLNYNPLHNTSNWKPHTLGVYGRKGDLLWVNPAPDSYQNLEVVVASMLGWFGDQEPKKVMCEPEVFDAAVQLVGHATTVSGSQRMFSLPWKLPVDTFIAWMWEHAPAQWEAFSERAGDYEQSNSWGGR